MGWKLKVLALLAVLAGGFVFAFSRTDPKPATGPWTQYQQAPQQTLEQWADTQWPQRSAPIDTSGQVAQQQAQDAQLAALRDIQNTQTTMRREAQEASYQAQRQVEEARIRAQQQAADAEYAARSQARINGY